MDTTYEETPIVPRFVQPYIYYEPGQQFRTSDFRMSKRKDEPVGWDFEDVRLRENVNENWWFVPLGNVEIAPIRSESHETSQQPPGIPKNLVIDIIGPIKYFGSGLIVDATSFTIIGCYKNYADSRPSEADAIDDLLEEQNESIADTTISIATKKWEGRLKGGLTRVEAMWVGKKRKALEKLQSKYCRERTLLADNRPHRIAMHEKALLAINYQMDGCQLSRYGKRYQSLFEDFKRAIGKEFKVSEDVPVFVKNSIWYRGDGGGERNQSGGPGHMAVEELGEGGNPGEDIE